MRKSFLFSIAIAFKKQQQKKVHINLTRFLLSLNGMKLEFSQMYHESGTNQLFKSCFLLLLHARSAISPNKCPLSVEFHFLLLRDFLNVIEA